MSPTLPYTDDTFYDLDECLDVLRGDRGPRDGEDTDD